MKILFILFFKNFIKLFSISIDLASTETSLIAEKPKLATFFLEEFLSIFCLSHDLINIKNVILMPLIFFFFLSKEIGNFFPFENWINRKLIAIYAKDLKFEKFEMEKFLLEKKSGSWSSKKKSKNPFFWQAKLNL